jgi:Holliday junction resolvase
MVSTWQGITYKGGKDMATKKKVNSKAKGARFELELSKIFKEYGFAEARRTAQYCGNTGDASDVIGLPGIWIEAKHQETMRLYEWMEQAKNDAKASGKANILPAVFHKKNRADVLVTMTLDDWMQLYKGRKTPTKMLFEGGES